MDVVQHYSDLLKKHGDDPRAVQLADRMTQRRRFRVLTEPLESMHGSSVMDVGCGLAHLAEFLAENGLDGEYTGIDINQDFVDVCRAKFPETRFECLDISRTTPGWESDLVVCNGMFNNPCTDPKAFVRCSLRNMYAVTRRVMSFNLMSSYVDFFDPNLLYFDPEDIFRFCKEELSPLVSLRHDYQVRPGVVPFEFAVYVFRTAEPCRRQMKEGPVSVGRRAPEPSGGLGTDGTWHPSKADCPL